MAIGKESDFVIFQDEFFGGMVEVEAQAADAFNAASRNCIQLHPAKTRGNYTSESFIDQIATSVLAGRRDTTSVSTKTDTAMTMDQINSVKLDRILGPIGMNISAFKKIAPGEDGQRKFSFAIGKQFAKAKLAEQLNSGLAACEAALGGESALSFDGTAGVLTHARLNSMLALAGDAAAEIECLVMHSKSWFDLIGQAIGSSGFDGIATATIQGASPATFGRPVVITDTASLQTGAGSTLQYQVLGLRKGAIVLTDNSDELTIASDIVTGLDNLAYRVQGEYSYNVSLKGFKWDIANGAANPTDATLITATNWDKAVTQDKRLAGVHMDVD